MAAAHQPVLDNVGWTYIGAAIAWTSILAIAMTFLWYHRRLPQLQIRRLPLVFVAVILLHMYLVLCMIGYVIGPVAPCTAEYWIMSIFVPCGIAIFQVSNTQFFHIASQQKRFLSMQRLEDLMRGKQVSILDGKAGSLWHRMYQRLCNIDHITRMVIFVSIGMTVQAALTLFIFLASSKFHPDFGFLPANLFGTDSEKRVQCSRGWEWWLSIAWQFFWAWIYAPYILWKSRNIKDTHGWRVQTILCCIAGLPCSPLWLCGLYLPQFAPVNKVFIPPNWFSVSIALIESFTIFIPVYQVCRQHNLRTETLTAITNWEAKNKAFGSVYSGSTKVSSPTELSFKSSDASEKGIVGVHTKIVSDSCGRSGKSQLYTMAAFENALRWNPKPLQSFAALKDFSGENISFLIHLSNWRKNWKTPESRDSSNPFETSDEKDFEQREDQHLREHFNHALCLYAAFISTNLAEFPVNLAFRTQKALDIVFAKPADLLFGDSSSAISGTSTNASSSVVTPFADSPVSGHHVFPEVGSGVNSSSSVYNDSDAVWYWGPIPTTFSRESFDEAEKEIKYLVLTNTWPKFVNAGYAEQIQDDQGRTLGRRLSKAIFGWENSSP